MNNIKNKIIPFICGLCLAGGVAYASLSEQEIISTAFIPVIQTETSDTATSTIAYKFDIKTIKETASTTAPSTYDYATTTYTKTISQDEWNYCRATKSQKECEAEVERIVADSKEYHLEVAEAEMKALQDKLNRTNYWEELTIKEQQI